MTQKEFAQAIGASKPTVERWKTLDLPFYDPLMIIEKTKGWMAEDDFWIEVER